MEEIRRFFGGLFSNIAYRFKYRVIDATERKVEKTVVLQKLRCFGKNSICTYCSCSSMMISLPSHLLLVPIVCKISYILRCAYPVGRMRY